MKKALLFTLSFLCLGIYNSLAISPIGADITYKFIGGAKYEVTINIFRSCASDTLGTVNGTVRIGDSTRIFYPTRTQWKDITPTCPTAFSKCSGNNAAISIGIEVHTYKDTIDLSKNPYKQWIDSGNCEVIFEWAQNNRDSRITSIKNGAFYISAIMNVCNINKTAKSYNNSPSFTNDPIVFLCCSNPIYYNHGALDTLEHDSLSYSFVDPKSNYKTNSQFNSPFSTQFPMTPKCRKAGDVSCKPNPGAKPPLGLYLDTYNGDIVFTPTKCDEIGVIVLEVKEWRKDSSGKYLVIGTTRRDLQYEVYNCGSNWPPDIESGKYVYTFCEGEKINIKLVGKDHPHPSDPNGKKDTVTLGWNGGLKGKGTFTILDTTSREKEAEFTWQTEIGDAQDVPYTYTVNATDDACPMNGVSSRAFSIKVLPKIKITSKSYSTFCDKIVVDVKVKEDKNRPYSVSWVLIDSAAPKIVVDIKTKEKDTFTVKTASTYYVELSVYAVYDCPSLFRDTIRFNPILNALNLAKDTTIGYYDTLTFHAGNGNTSYLWSDNSIDSTLTINGLDIGPGIHNINVEVINNVGCKYQDKVKVTVNGCKDNITPTLSATKKHFEICAGEELYFTFDVKDSITKDYIRKDYCKIDNLNKFGVLSYLDSTARNKTGIFTWKTSYKDGSGTPYNLKFRYYDDACPSTYKEEVFTVLVNPVASASLTSSLVCDVYGMGVILGKNFPLPATYNWVVTDSVSNKVVSTSSKDKLNFKALNETTYKINLTIAPADGCNISFENNIRLSPFKGKELLGPNRTISLFDSLILKAGPFSSYSWSTGSKADSILLYGEKLGAGISYIKLTTTDSLGCIYTDNIYIDVKCPPSTLDIGGNRTADLWDLLILSANRDYTSYTWSNGAKTKTVNIRASNLGTGTHAFALTISDKYRCRYTDSMKLTVTNLTSIKDVLYETIKVYPTPTKDILHIALPPNFKNGIVEITNTLGKIVLTKELLEISEEVYGLHVSHLPKGLYFLKLTTKEREYSTKWIKD